MYENHRHLEMHLGSCMGIAFLYCFRARVASVQAISNQTEYDLELENFVFEFKHIFREKSDI